MILMGAKNQPLLGGSFDDRLTTICAAFWANPVRDMIFAAAFADNQMVERQRIVRTPPVTTTLG